MLDNENIEIEFQNEIITKETVEEEPKPSSSKKRLNLSKLLLLPQGVTIKQFVIDMLLVLVGCLMMAVSAIVFFIPYNVVSGGFSGFAFALSWLYEDTFMSWLSPAILIIIMNVPLFIIAIKIKGRNFGIMALIGTVAFSIFIFVFEILELTFNLNYYFIQITNNEPLLATLYGGAVSGIGWGLLVRRGGSTGGSDMLSSVLHAKYPLLNYGTILLMIDGFVVLFSGFVNAIIYQGNDNAILHGINRMLFSFIAIFLTAMIADYIIVGKNRAVTYFIICDKPQEMADAIVQNIRRGVTALTARGVYNNTDREVLVCVVKRSQSINLKRLVFEIDKKAFMFANATNEVYGQGFLTDLK